MMLSLIFLFSVQWQNVTIPVNDTMQEYGVYLSISPTELKSVFVDSAFRAWYEIQLLVYDKKGRQLAGDYWERSVMLDSVDIVDTAVLLIPRTAVKYNLRIVDLYAGEILNISDKIMSAKFLSNIRWFLSDDTLSVFYTVLNASGDADTMIILLNGMNIQSVSARPGVYEDSTVTFTGDLPIAEYVMEIRMRSKGKNLDAVRVPIKVTRNFYRDEKMWALRVNQLEYIATAAEIDRLRKAEKNARDSLWNDFWKQYDPTPNTASNEKEVEYFERIAYSEEHFSFGDKGWRSDRAKIYVKHGAPDELVSKPYELSTKPYEVWYYYKMNLKFIFYDRFGFGEYILINQAGERI